jgi:glycosyltransferase involved in cell wall biosynthesis
LPRIAYILPSFAASDDDWCIPVISNFIASMADDCTPVVYALHYPYRRSTYAARKVTVHCLSEGKQGGLRRLQLWRDLMRRVERDHRATSFDLIHAFWATETGYFATRLGRRLGVPSIVSLGGGELARLEEQRYGAQRSPWQRYFVSRALADADLLTAGSQWLAERVPQEHQRKLHVAPLGVDNDMFVPAPMRTGRRLLAAASLQPLKDYPTLLNAVAMVRQQMPDVTLDIAGYSDATEADRLRKLAVQLGLETVVRFLGDIPHDQMPDLFAEHDLLVHGSLWEAQGMVVLEALARGLPVVSSRVGIAAELPASLVRTFTPGNTSEMARAISESLSTDDHAQAVARAGPSLVRSNYALGIVANHFVELYQQLIQ